jgi:site-specific DNA-cytosine methylase
VSRICQPQSKVATVDFGTTFLKSVALTKSGGKIDILSGGFPCQDISVAGQNRGIAADTQSGLFFEFIRVVSEIQPRIVIFENVPQVRKYRVVPELFETNG